MSDSNGRCPVTGARTSIGAGSNQDWWPNQLNLRILHQHSPLSNPMGEEFDYAKEFATLDLDALKQDIMDGSPEGVFTTMNKIHLLGLFLVLSLSACESSDPEDQIPVAI